MVDTGLSTPLPTDHPVRVVGLRTKDAGVNPKDRIGATKLDMTLLPVSAKIEWAKAQMDGGLFKYGEYNWRVEPVQIMTYLGAAMRHLDSYLEGEEVDPVSKVHHLGHAMACCAIIIDAVVHEMAVDNRPINCRVDIPEMIRDAANWVKERKAQG